MPGVFRCRYSHVRRFLRKRTVGEEETMLEASKGAFELSGVESVEKG